MTEAFERRFAAHGQCYGLRADDRFLLDRLSARVPSGWHPLAVTLTEASAWYALRRADGPETLCLTIDADTLIESSNLPETLDAFERHAELLAAERARDSLFVHAGVVAWNGQAIVMPGASFAGKTTLVQAWLEAGATYYSDEFAVLDRGGRVHPFARPLSIRDGSTASSRRVPVAALGAATGTTPLRVGLVLVTSYRTGARWRPRRLTPAPTLLALMRHTVAARGNPEHSMPILKRTVTGGIAFAGLRGEARELVAAVLRHVRTPMLSAAPRQGAI